MTTTISKRKLRKSIVTSVLQHIDSKVNHKQISSKQLHSDLELDMIEITQILIDLSEEYNFDITGITVFKIKDYTVNELVDFLHKYINGESS